MALCHLKALEIRGIMSEMHVGVVVRWFCFVQVYEKFQVN
jgi:hypothetical protein